MFSHRFLTEIPLVQHQKPVFCPRHRRPQQPTHYPACQEEKASEPGACPWDEGEEMPVNAGVKKPPLGWG